MSPYYSDSLVTIYHGDCREILPTLGACGAVVSDPPYPNKAGHFNDGIDAAGDICRDYFFFAEHWLLFWDEMTVPPVKMPLVARHIWHRTNTNRPDNYEAIYEFHADGKRGHLVFSRLP